MNFDFTFTKTIDKNGRLVIPAPLRKRYGLDIGGEVQFITLPKGLIIQPLAEEQKINPRLLRRKITE